MKQFRAHYGCPVELALEFVDGKWKTLILSYLKESPHRYNELKARLPGVADKVLTERLQDLERLGLILKTARAEGEAAQVYQLTQRGESLRPVLDALYRWGNAVAAELKIDVGLN